MMLTKSVTFEKNHWELSLDYEKDVQRMLCSYLIGPMYFKASTNKYLLFPTFHWKQFQPLYDRLRQFDVCWYPLIPKLTKVTA